MRLNKYGVFAILYCASLPVVSSVNDPTKPIYSENKDSSIITNAVLEERKVVVLQSIFFSPKNKSAVVNGNVYKEGDVSDDITLKSIQKNHVVVKYKENSVTLELSKKRYLNKVTGEVSE